MSDVALRTLVLSSALHPQLARALAVQMSTGCLSFDLGGEVELREVRAMRRPSANILVRAVLLIVGACHGDTQALAGR